MVFDKVSFVSVIDALYKQSRIDEKYSEDLSDLIKSDGIVPTYNNSCLFNVLIELLQKQFIPVGGCCEIERYCFELRYGYNSEGIRVITPEMLWDQLNSGNVKGSILCPVEEIENIQK